MKLVTNADRMDVDAFQGVLDLCPDVAARFEEQADGAGRDLLRDGFASLVKYAPELREEIPADRCVNARVVSDAMGLEEYRRLRAYTRGDHVASLGALRALLKDFSLPPEVEQAQAAAQQAADEVERFLNGEEGELTPERLAALKQSLEAAASDLDDALDEAQHDLRQQVREGLTAAADAAEAAQHAARALGWGDEEGALISVPLAERAKLASLLEKQPGLREIMRLAGRLIIEAGRRQRDKPIQASTQVSGVGEGDDLANVTPSEWALLADEETEDQFYRRFGEASLQQYELADRTQEVEGPVLVGLDVSGSMTGYPDVWAKAVALAMYSIARRQRRAFGLYLFNTRVVSHILIPAGDSNPEALAETLLTGPSGGTNFVPVLSEMMTRIEEDRRSDILFVTDGLCRLGGDAAGFLERKAASGSKLLSVRIGAHRLPGEDELTKISDQVFDLKGDIINNEKDATSVAFSI